MSVVPETQSAKISFYQSHLGSFAEHAAEIGTSPERVADLADKTAEARAAFIEAGQARAAAQVATRRLNAALAAMDVTGQAIIKQVRARAAVAGDGVYRLANFPAPAEPAPVGAPGTPSRLQVTLLTLGELALKWQCRNPARGRGVIYQIYRRDGAAGEFQYLGAAGERKFRDVTVPAGATQVTYRIQATRTTAAGDAAFFPVYLGVSAEVAKLAKLGAIRANGNLAA